MAARSLALKFFAVLMIADALRYLWAGDGYHALASVFIAALGLLADRWFIRRRE